MNEPKGSPTNSIHSGLPKKPWQIIVLAICGLGAVGIVGLGLLAMLLVPTLPAVDNLVEARLKVPLRVYTADGKLIAEFGEEKRIPVRIDEAPPLLVRAILAAEDHSFFQHHGVDFIGIARAAWYNFRSGTPSQGASTITMQVARNFFLSPEKTYTRKFREVLLSFKIERELTKQQILELYINKIFLGHRAYGFAAAAQIYYGRKLDELTLPQMAMLAGLPKAPSRDNPLTNPEGALSRRDYVLRHMQSLGYIDKAQLEAALAVPLTASRHAFRYEVEAPYVAEMVRQHMLSAYDEKTYAGGFDVYTTIDSTKQTAANEAVRKGMLAYDRRHGYRGPTGHISVRGDFDPTRLDDVLKDFRVVGGLLPGVVIKIEEKAASVYTQDGFITAVEWPGLAWARRYVDENTLGPPVKTAADVVKRGDIVYLEFVPESPAPAEATKEAEVESPGFWRLAQIPQVSAALVSLRPSDGAVLALVGGFDFSQSSFNRVVQAERQPGSSFKPFIYAAALDKGLTPATTVSGAPIVIEDAQLEDEWRPENYTKKFFGPTRLRKALALSLNTVSIRLLRGIGASYVADYLPRFGFDAASLPRNLSLALGSASVTPMKLAAAFTVFANGGYLINPYFITRVEDANHEILEKADPRVACQNCPDRPLNPPGDNASPAASVAVAQTTAAAEKGGTISPASSSNVAKGTIAAATPTGPHYAPRVLSAETTFIMTTMLQDVIRDGTGRAALALGRKDLAGKTGTTNDYRDAWFAGFNADVVTVAWTGFDQPASLGHGEAGSRAALPIWMDYMRVALNGAPPSVLSVPETIERRWINEETGLPAAESDPGAIEEYFVKDAAPAGAALPGEPTAPVEGKSPDAPSEPPPTVPENIREKLF